MKRKIMVKKKSNKAMKNKTISKKEFANKEIKKPAKEEKKDFWSNLGNFVKKSIDCCLE